MKHNRRIKTLQRKHYHKNVFRYKDGFGNKIIVIIDNSTQTKYKLAVKIPYTLPIAFVRDPINNQYHCAHINLKDYE